jgi:pilus assembly protein CpaC
MTKATLFRTATAAALIVMALLGQSAPVTAADPAGKAFGPTVQIHGDKAAQFIPLGVSKSIVVDLPGDVKDVLVADPLIANAVVRTSRRAYIIGVKVGQTNIYFFDADGKQLMAFDIAVTRDLNGVRAALKRALPDSDIAIEGLSADGLVLTGSVASPAESQQAFDLAARLVGDGAKVVNGITVRGRDQVMLKVTVAEVQRDVIKQLGIDLNRQLSSGQTLGVINNNPFPVNQPLVSGNLIQLSYRGVSATLRAMERAGVVRTLAEPNLTAISGETATFLAGGEFPVISGVTCNPPGSAQCQATVEFKKFGVGLNFTPVVLSEGRISLKVLTEVSELATEGAIVTAGITIPSLVVRRADTTVEIPSGGSLAMAGMIKDQTKQQLNGIPGLMNLPVLGALFKSRDFVNHQTELMVIVTPYIVRAVAQKDLSKPDDGYADASDPATSLLGRFNRLYGTPGQDNSREKTYRGNVGFILD